MSQLNNYQSLIDQITQGRNDANTANKGRYTEIKGLLEALIGRSGTTYDEILRNLSTQGREAKFNVGQQAKRSAASAAQDLTNRGLGNTTITSSVNRGIQSDAARARQNIDEGLAAQQAGVRQSRLQSDIQTTGMLSGLIERRNDTGPDLSLYASLLQQAMAAGAGGVGGSGAGGRTSTVIGPGSSSFGALRRSAGGGSGGGRTGVTTFTNGGQVPTGSVRTPGGARAGEFEQGPAMQSYYRPGVLGFQGASPREFASAAGAKAAGYGYRMQGPNNFVRV